MSIRGYRKLGEPLEDTRPSSALDVRTARGLHPVQRLNARTQFRPGDAVFGWCGGAFAEYACTSESALVIKPDNVTFEQAASVPVAAGQIKELIFSRYKFV